ncbi:MAG: ABC transporter ATP-binding protein [Pseudohongiellaceae bacterium]
MLTLTHVSKTYPGNVRALQDISLEIPRGLFGLLGPNGAGKSSLMRTVATLQAPDAGSVQFAGFDVFADRMRLRRTLGYLPQEFGAYPGTSALSMLKHLATLKGLQGQSRETTVEDLLHKTNLWEVRNQSVDKFSGGMKQRFGIAQALLGDPKLLIVDEPTAGLDPAERRRFQNLLVQVGEEVVVILSTHIVDDVEDICSNVAIMGQGRILLQGEPAALIRHLEGKLWKTLVPAQEVATMRASHTVISTRLKSGATEVRVTADAQPPGMTAVQPTLEDIYFSTLIASGLTENLE